jgi:hypothetical protein
MIFQRQYWLLEDQKKLKPINRPIKQVSAIYIWNNDNYNNTDWTFLF